MGGETRNYHARNFSFLFKLIFKRNKKLMASFLSKHIVQELLHRTKNRGHRNSAKYFLWLEQYAHEQYLSITSNANNTCLSEQLSKTIAAHEFEFKWNTVSVLLGPFIPKSLEPSGGKKESIWFQIEVYFPCDLQGIIKRKRIIKRAASDTMSATPKHAKCVL